MTPHIYLERFCYSLMGTFGRLSAEDTLCFTVEQPWNNNKPFASCIPEGDYIIRRVEGLEKQGAEWQFIDVPGRTAIEFHVANTIKDVVGCIGLGDQLGFVYGRWAVLNSAATTKAFNFAMKPYDEAEIHITHYKTK